MIIHLQLLINIQFEWDTFENEILIKIIIIKTNR